MNDYLNQSIDELADEALEGILLVIEDQLYYDPKKDASYEFKVEFDGFGYLTIDQLLELDSESILKIASQIYGS